MPKAGDTFSFRLNAAEWLSGRVLLDVKAQCVKPRKVAPDSQLGFFNAALLVEMYATPTPEPAIDASRVLVPSMFVSPGGFKGDWQVLGNQPVDPTAIEFPPALVLRGIRGALTWGEILLESSLPGAEIDGLRISSTVHGAGLVRAVCMVALGRGAELDPLEFPNPSVFALGHSDLRFSPHRDRVFESVGLAKHGSYHEEALARGFDVRRFFA